MPKKKKIAVAMSGGVDSTVAAKILKEEGHELIGLFLKLWTDPVCSRGERENACCDLRALNDAKAVADRLDIPFYVINAEKEFKQAVVDEFLDEYRNLRTPNPCITCNEKIKFGYLFRKMRALDCDMLATGHYARIEKYSDGYKLLRGVDSGKDQSYMLYRLTQDELKRLSFPVGGLKKYDVKKTAGDFFKKISVKPESQEICFVGDSGYREFLERHLGDKYFQPGEIVKTSGEVVGRHRGLINYTIGQRKGVNYIASSKSSDTEPLYVVGYNIEKNHLLVGSNEEVYKKEMLVNKLNFISASAFQDLKSTDLEVKIRYRHSSVQCRIEKIGGLKVWQDKHENNGMHDENNNPSSGKLKVVFDEPQRAITPGQSAVFYRGDEVLGGGVIEGR